MKLGGFLLLLAFIIICQVFTFTEPFSQLYLASSSKCFQCERALPDPIKWMGQPTKSFAAESQLAATAPYWGAYGGKSKCFACQKQLAEMDRNRVRNNSSVNDLYSGWKFPGSYVD